MYLPVLVSLSQHTHKQTPLYKQKYKYKLMFMPLPLLSHKQMPKQQLRHRHLSPVCVFVVTHTLSTDMII